MSTRRAYPSPSTPLTNTQKARLCILKEGFPGVSADEFCAHMRCNDTTVVTRIEFEYAK